MSRSKYLYVCFLCLLFLKDEASSNFIMINAREDAEAGNYNDYDPLADAGDPYLPNESEYLAKNKINYLEPSSKVTTCYVFGLNQQKCIDILKRSVKLLRRNIEIDPSVKLRYATR